MSDPYGKVSEEVFEMAEQNARQLRDVALWDAFTGEPCPLCQSVEGRCNYHREIDHLKEQLEDLQSHLEALHQISENINTGAYEK